MTNPKIPVKIELKNPVDLISAGECHSVAANSQIGNFFIWGKIKCTEKNLMKTEEILECKFYALKR